MGRGAAAGAYEVSRAVVANAEEDRVCMRVSGVRVALRRHQDGRVAEAAAALLLLLLLLDPTAGCMGCT